MSYYDGRRNKRRGKKREAVLSGVIGISMVLFFCLIGAIFLVEP